MGSKLPTDLFPSPDGAAPSSSMGNEGRQLRSRLVEFCNVCRKPVQSSTNIGKTFASHAHCTCVTPPSTIGSVHGCDNSAPMSSPRKKKLDTTTIVSSTSRRELFKESANTPQQQQLVETRLGESLSSSSSSSSGPSTSKLETKSAENTTTMAVTKSTLLSSSSSSSSLLSSSVKVPKSRHSCTYCSKCFNTPGKLNQHMFSHTGEKPFVCSHCSKAFSSKFKLVRHILIHSDLRQYRCTVCERTFHRKDHLKNHSKVHSPVKQRFKCDRVDCAKEYSSMLSYRKHIAVHSAKEGNLECKICGKTFETKEETLFHLKVHAGSRSLKMPADRKYQCDHCDRSFFTGKDVRRHLVVHTGRRDFLCQYCPQRFGRKDHLTRHIKKSHSASAKKARLKKTVASETEKTKSIEDVLMEVEMDMFKQKHPAALKKATVMAELGECSEGGGVDSGGSALASRPATVAGMAEDEEDDLCKMHGLDSPVDVAKLETSPDILPMVAIDDDRPVTSSDATKVEQDLMYNMLDNIPFAKYEHYPYTAAAAAAATAATAATTGYSYSQPELMDEPSTSSHTLLPHLAYHHHHHHHQHQHHHHHHHQQQQQQQQQPQLQQHAPPPPPPPPPPPYPSEMDVSFDSAPPTAADTSSSDTIKVESDYATERQSSTLDLVLPPITNVSPSMGGCSLLMNPNFQNLLASSVPQTQPQSAAAAETATAGMTEDGLDDTDSQTNAEQLFNFLPTSNEIIASLLLSPDPRSDSAPLPGFNQAFHQQP